MVSSDQAPTGVGEPDVPPITPAVKENRMDSMNLQVLKAAVGWLDAGESVRLVTVVQTYGSSPRPVGALLAVAGGGFAGSLSGGCVEDDLIERLTTRPPVKPEVVTYGITREESRRLKLPCGGTLKLVVEPVQDGYGLSQVLAAVERHQITRRRLDLITGQVEILPGDSSHELYFDGETLISVYGPRWRLLIIGAGQTSDYLARMAQALDYQVLICDPREDYARGWEVPGTEWLAGMPDDAVAAISPDPHTAIVALTHDPRLDDMALLEALTSGAFYVGALGSKANNAKRRERLARHFDLSPGQLARLHGPVGLPIGSHTPPEIAIAILAEITALRHGIRLTVAPEKIQPGSQSSPVTSHG